MIDPLRYRSVQEQVEYDQHDTPIQCWQCQREKIATPAFFICHDCGKVGSTRPFCEPCFFDYHATKKKGKGEHKPHLIVRGDPVIVQTLADGDRATFAKLHDWVTLDYTLTTDESDVVVEDTFLTKQPLTFQSGCSGPCIHLQLLGCTEIAAADILGSSDPYCAVYWKGELAGVTTTKHMTLNPSWTNQTFVLPLPEDFMAALTGDASSSALFNAGLLLPKLRIELYDWDRLSKNDFLGQVSVSDSDILGILRQAQSGETDEDAVLSFNLMPKQSRGRLGIRAALRVGQLLVQVLRAENLPKADPISLSDPYCEVYWNNKKVGTTAYIDDTLDPVWDLEIFSIKVDAEGPNSVELSTLRIECLDRDQFGSDDVLGQIELTGSQIIQLLGSGEQDGPMGTTEDDAVGEADLERIFAFIQTFQKHQKEEGSLGKMIVGVPQDPKVTNVNSEENIVVPHEPAEVASVPLENKKSQQENKRPDVAMETAGYSEGKENRDDGNMIRESGTAQDRQGSRGAGGDEGAGAFKYNIQQPQQQSNTAGQCLDARARSDIEGGAVAGNAQQGDHTEYTGSQARTPNGVVSANGNNVRADKERLGLVAIAEGVGDKKHDITTVAGDVDTSCPDRTKGNLGVVDAGVPTVEAGSVVNSQKPPESCGESDHLLKSSLDAEVQLARIPTGGEPAPVEALRSDVEEGGRASGTALVEEMVVVPKDETGPRPVLGGRGPIGASYRDAIVQRFEEDRGILLHYVDDNSAAWITTRFIPLLQIREQTPAARSLLQRVWDERLTLFHLHKRVLNVKRGLKVLLEMAMTGSRMQWYQLSLTDEQSGANFVRGTVNCRFLYHTRGSVVRGLDVAVSHMSLGERARVEVRSDYGFGEVYAGRKVPPNATLVFVAQVAAIGNLSAKWVLLRRAVKDAVDDALFRVRGYLSRSRASSTKASARLVGLLASLRKKRAGSDWQDDSATENRGSNVGDEIPDVESVQSGSVSGAVAESPDDRVLLVKPRR